MSQLTEKLSVRPKLNAGLEVCSMSRIPCICSAVMVGGKAMPHYHETNQTAVTSVFFNFPTPATDEGESTT